MEWGWRLSFLTCGLLGVLGYFLRKKLHESYEFKHLQIARKVLESPVRETFKKYKKEVLLGFCVSVFEVVSFCLLTIIPVIYFKDLFQLSDSQNLLISSLALIACTVLPPVIGKFADIFKRIPLLEISALGFIALSYIFFSAIYNSNLKLTLIIQAILILLFSVQVALLPSLLADLFPAPIRYTGIGFSFNVCDGVLWGLVPILSIYMIQKSGQVASFVILFPIAAFVFLISYNFIKKSVKISY